MDIKKEFAFVLSDESVKDFFERLRTREPVFSIFDSLESFVASLNARASQNYELKDLCMLKLIERIQITSDKSVGLNLITYLLAPGLQRILQNILRGNKDIRAIWLLLWAEFFQCVQAYNLQKRQQKVAANILFDTYHRISEVMQTEYDWNKKTKPLEKWEIEIVNVELPNIHKQVMAFLQGDEDAGLKAVDIDIIISSRIYGESMKSTAQRLGLDYHNALKRRFRAEEQLRNYWWERANSD